MKEVPGSPLAEEKKGQNRADVTTAAFISVVSLAVLSALIFSMDDINITIIGASPREEVTYGEQRWDTVAAVAHFLLLVPVAMSILALATRRFNRAMYLHLAQRAGIAGLVTIILALSAGAFIDHGRDEPARHQRSLVNSFDFGQTSQRSTETYFHDGVLKSFTHFTLGGSEQDACDAVAAVFRGSPSTDENAGRCSQTRSEDGQTLNAYVSVSNPRDPSGVRTRVMITTEQTEPFSRN